MTVTVGPHVTSVQTFRIYIQNYLKDFHEVLTTDESEDVDDEELADYLEHYATGIVTFLALDLAHLGPQGRLKWMESLMDYIYEMVDELPPRAP